MSDFELDRGVIAQLREAVDMVDVVSEHVRLKKRGKSWEGLCPFHDEKTPSFSVDPEKGLYFCFGCRAGGDVFKFVMELERLSFPEAVERLARRFGVALPERSPQVRRQRQRAETLRGILEETQRWFAANLRRPEAAAARAELERRGFAASCWDDVGFGWAPDHWRALAEELGRRHPTGVLLEAGVLVQAERGGSPYDRFRSRVTFPIRTGDGRLVAFGGRIIGDGEPKYLNSPEGPLFTKRATLFCLDRARREIGQRGEAVVVEGYFDCLSLHRVGITWSVATLGTALTADHARLLRRRLGAEGRVILCYDADAAGRRAATTGAGVVLEAGLDVAILDLPPGTDPDDVVREQGAEAFRALLEAPTSLVDFLLADLPEAPTERRRQAAELARVIGSARDPHTRDELFFELSRRLGFSQAVLRDLARAGRPGTATAAVSDSSLASGEAMLVRIAVDGSEAWRQAIAELVDPGLRRDPRVGRLVSALRDGQTSGACRDLLGWLREHGDDPELELLVAEVSARPAPPLTDDSARRQMTLLVREQARIAASRLTAEIARAEAAGDTDRVAQLQLEQAELRRQIPQLP